MSRILIVGALAWDRPVWLEAPVASGIRLRGRTLGGALEGRLGGGCRREPRAGEEKRRDREPAHERPRA
jgi:hypothetical protein